MRYIDRSLLASPDYWDDTAQAAKDAVAGGDSVGDHDAVWQAFKPALEAIVGKKCWYCETIQSRSDKEVEHFRPKGRITGVKPKHTGYTWLAFEKSNYRYSCAYCNKRRKDEGNKDRLGGKGNHFPLVDETMRARTPGDEVHESPMLIDPLIRTEAEMLSFEENGLPCYSDGLNEGDKKRMDVSVRLYHLDHSEIVEDRLALAENINEEINDADYFFEKFKNGDGDAQDRFLVKLEKLRKAYDIKSRYSLFAEKYLHCRVKDYDWMNLVFE